MREIVHIQTGQCGNQIGAKVSRLSLCIVCKFERESVSRRVRIVRPPVISPPMHRQPGNGRRCRDGFER